MSELRNVTAFGAARLVDLFLDLRELGLEFGNLILAPEDTGGRLVAVSVAGTAGEDAVAGEQFAGRGDKVERAVALAPRGGRGGEVWNDPRQAEQPLHERTN